MSENQEKAIVGAFSVILKTGCGTDGALHSTNPPQHCVPGAGVLRGRVGLPARAVGGEGGPGVRHHLRQEVRLEEGGDNRNTPDCEKLDNQYTPAQCTML